jgi:hypothetical protein
MLLLAVSSIQSQVRKIIWAAVELDLRELSAALPTKQKLKNLQVEDDSARPLFI